jgi:hypothetical protein
LAPDGSHLLIGSAIEIWGVALPRGEPVPLLPGWGFRQVAHVAGGLGAVVGNDKLYLLDLRAGTVLNTLGWSLRELTPVCDGRFAVLHRYSKEWRTGVLGVTDAGPVLLGTFPTDIASVYEHDDGRVYAPGYEIIGLDRALESPELDVLADGA